MLRTSPAVSGSLGLFNPVGNGFFVSSVSTIGQDAIREAIGCVERNNKDRDPSGRSSSPRPPRVQCSEWSLLRQLLFYRRRATVLPMDESIEGRIRIEHLHKTFVKKHEGIVALRDINLTIQRGEFVVIIGHSGSGKSSLLNVLGTLDTPSSGSYALGNVVINQNVMICFYVSLLQKTSEKTLSDLRRDKIGFVFQSFNLIPKLTALQNVELPMLLKGKFSAEDRRERALSLLEQVGLSHRVSHTLVELSGGEQQRVTIARALANDPSLLLLDEPTGDLDEKSTEEVMRIMKTLQEEQAKTIVMVTHNMGLQRFATRVVSMNHGTIVKIEDCAAA